MHDVPLTAKRADWHTATNDLTQAGQIRRDTVVSLGTAQRDAETGHHLIKNQDAAVLVTNVAQGFQETWLRRNAVHIARHRLDDDAGNLLTDLGKARFHPLRVVIGECNGVLGQRRRNTRRAGLAVGQGTGARFYQQGVRVAVVVTLELDDLIATRGAPRQPNR